MTAPAPERGDRPQVGVSDAETRRPPLARVRQSVAAVLDGGRARGVRAFAVALCAIAAVLVSTAWSSASPIGSSPDEGQHLQYAYGVASGEALPWNMEFVRDEAGRPFAQVTMPVELFEFPSSSCYAGKQSQPGACELNSTLREQRGDVAPDGTFVGSTHMTTYPVVYYAYAGTVMHAGLAVGLSGPHTLLLTRILSGLLSAAVLALTARVAARRFGVGATAVVMLAACTPMAVYMFTSINPNGLEISTAMLLAACVAAVRHDLAARGHVTVRMQVLLVVTTAALIGTRPLSVAWAACLLALLAVPVPGGPWPLRRLHWATVGLLLSLGAFGVGWMLWSNGVRESAGLGSDEWDAYPLPLRLLLVVLKFGDLVRQSVGMFGWADTPLPFAVVLAWVVLAATCVVSLRDRSRVASTPPGVALLFLGLSALVVMAQSIIGAFGWQGRYWLPAIAAFLVLLAPSLTRTTRGVPAVTVAVVTLLAIQTFALTWQALRYVYGYESYYNRFEAVPWPDGLPGWQPAGGLEAVVLAATVGAVALGVGVLLLHRTDRGAAPAETDKTGL